MTETTTTEPTPEPTPTPTPEPAPDYSQDLEQILAELVKFNEAYMAELKRQGDEREAEAKAEAQAKAEAEANPDTFQTDLLQSLQDMQKQQGDILLALDNTSETTYQEEQKIFQAKQEELYTIGLESLVILIGLVIGFMVSKSFLKGMVPG